MAYHKKNKLHIVAVTAAILNQVGQLLICKRAAREIAFPGRWALPGGKVEDNQTVIQALKEECLEEVGLKIGNRKIYLDDGAFVRPDKQTVKVFCYLVFAKDFKVKLDPNDFSEYKWVGVDEIDKYKVLGMNKRTLLKALESFKK